MKSDTDSNIFNAYAQGITSCSRVDESDLYSQVYTEQAINENGQQSLGGIYESMLIEEMVDESNKNKDISDAYTVVTEQKAPEQPQSFEQYYYIPDSCFETNNHKLV